MNPRSSSASALVVTSIHPPTQALEAFVRRAEEQAFDLILVADSKTPLEGYEAVSRRSSRFRFFSLEEQEHRFPRLARAVPRNHYARKNLGYALACSEGYVSIAETDDDNEPMPGWEPVPGPRTACRVSAPAGPGPVWTNVYRHFTSAHVWPRGFPLELVTAPEPCVRGLAESADQIWIWQGLASGDPDVDAIFRLTQKGAQQPLDFDANAPLALAKGVLSPFNSQNTFWVDPRSFILSYLPVTVSSRVCDILRGYVAQHLMWREGGCLGVLPASVIQRRNPHDLLEDLAAETPFLLNASRWNRALDDASRAGEAPDLRQAYEVLNRLGAVRPEEQAVVDAWLDAFENR